MYACHTFNLPSLRLILYTFPSPLSHPVQVARRPSNNDMYIPVVMP